MDSFFVQLALFNTSLGLANFEKNSSQEEMQERIEQKLDRILQMLAQRDKERE